ncbi:hypothetical protein EYF80_001663 [Liparis tanakae]|uniref:Uncharacterized protein n=1 Tax=Liparis tanakae TaxID=230148 RepID=A0A4Z2JFP3_9TELE|nr:hypothetical protein EYF80_001663 [Liparis tanakae]
MASQALKALLVFQELDRRESWGPKALQDFLASEVTKVRVDLLENLACLGRKAFLDLTVLLENLDPKVMQGILAYLETQD